MKSKVISFICIFLFFAMPLIAEDSSSAQPTVIPLSIKTGNKKRVPPMDSSFLVYQNGEVSLHTSISYDVAILDVYDCNGNIMYSVILTAEYNQEKADLEDGSMIVCTLDNDVVLCGQW